MVTETVIDVIQFNDLANHSREITYIDAIDRLCDLIDNDSQLNSYELKRIRKYAIQHFKDIDTMEY